MPEDPKTVLVVDDEAAVRDLVQALLKSLGYAVQTAANGLEALAQIQARTFDLVITDLMMPGMDGEQLAREIRKHTPALPVVLLTGYKPSAIPSEISRVLGKPFSRDQLRETVAALT